MPKYKATAYIRLSYTDDHSSESDSVSNQRKLIENFVERNPDIEVVSEKIDDGYSGIIFVVPVFPPIWFLKPYRKRKRRPVPSSTTPCNKFAIKNAVFSVITSLDSG